MKISWDNKAVMFKTEPVYYNAVASGKKRAEVRMMDAEESKDFTDVDAEYIILTDLFNENPMAFKITYKAPVAQILGVTLWLICFDEEES